VLFIISQVMQLQSTRGSNSLEKSLLSQREEVIQPAKSGNNHAVSLHNKRLLTTEKILKHKIRYKKINTAKARKIKKKSKSHKNAKYKENSGKRKLAKKNKRKNNIFIKEILDKTHRSKLSEPTAIDRRLVWIMATACGLSVANTVYAQPLLASMGRGFAVSVDHVGFVVTLSQLGYAIGLILVAPLGDKYNQRSLMVTLLCVLAVALVAMAAAPTVALLVIASCAVGLTSILAELIIPFAAGLVPSKERGRIVGIMVSGVLIGTLLANVVSGFVGEYLGWRAMYWIAAALMIVLGVVLRFMLPNDNSVKSDVGYLRLLGSLWQLLCSEPVLQEISIIGILIYGALNIFWVTISFFLETPPYNYGSNTVGLFGLVGIVGALVASFVGKFADHKDARQTNAIALPITLLSFAVMWLAGQWIIGLIIGAILLDLGVQSNHVANETRVYTLDPAVWNRANTIYIFMFCIGGSLGCTLGSIAWSIAQWNGVCIVGCLMLGVALGFYTLNSKRIRLWRESQAQQVPLPIELVAGA
jgi:predicted MFS family arabinose efflux permease